MKNKIVFGTGTRFGRLNKNLCAELVRYGIDNGIVNFDTGHSYSNGNSERRLGYSLTRMCNFKRNMFSISTKAGTKINKKGKYIKDFSPTVIKSQTLKSLKNLDIDYIDVLYLHGPEIEDLNNQELIEQLFSLKTEGIIRSLGINTHTTNLINLIANGSFPFIDQIMIDFNLLQLDRIDFMRKCNKANIRICAGTALAQGLLLDSPLRIALRSKSLFYLLRMIFKKETRSFIKDAKLLRNYLKKNFSQIAHKIPLSYVLNNQFVDEVSIGMLSKKSIDKNISILNNPISQDICEKVEKWSLLNSQL